MRILHCFIVITALVQMANFDTRCKAGDFPAVEQLPIRKDYPNPLVMFDGSKVANREQWTNKRRPELKQLFQHYMYGFLPPRPSEFTAVVESEDRNFFNGKATLTDLSLHFGKPEVATINLLLVVPNKRSGPLPTFLGINFCGNFSVVDSPQVRLSSDWVYSKCAGAEDNKPTDASRGGRTIRWDIEAVIDRGYAFAGFHSADLDPDFNDFSNGVHPRFYEDGQTQPKPHEWGAIAAWAWGAHRCVDYLETNPVIDSKKIAVVGHSRLGKTALLAGALDERIALSIPNQAGCGGTAPNRNSVGESVKRINDVFPHWFNDTFTKFNEQVERLPFDQHCLLALMAPRPVLVSNAEEDTWADPMGQFEMLKQADPVYRLLGVTDFDPPASPVMGQLIDSTLGYYIRPGKHSMTHGDWKVFLDYADKHLKGK